MARMSQETDNRKMLTVKEAADWLSVSDKVVYRLARTMELPACKIGGSLRFRPADVERYIEDCKVRPPVPPPRTAKSKSKANPKGKPSGYYPGMKVV